MKRTVITLSLAATLLVAGIVWAQCYQPGTFVGGYNGAIYGPTITPSRFIQSHDTFRRVADLSAGIPEVAGYEVVGVIADAAGTLRILDSTAVEVDIPLQPGLITHIKPQNVLPGGTLAAIVLVYRRI